MTTEQVITNARVVLPNAVFERGTVCFRDGLVFDIDAGRPSSPAAVNLEGDWLLPGLVELHTDNLERHVAPRPRVTFPMTSAVQAHDAEIAAAGITTVFDAIGVGDPYDEGFRAKDQSALLDALDALDSAEALRSDHMIHVRCELPAPNARTLFAPFARHRRLGLISLMDHTPGQRQWHDLERARVFYTGRKGWTDAQFDEQVRLAPERQSRYANPNRDWFVDFAHTHNVALATHDDTTVEQVDEAALLGARMSEFPTTLVAARRARERRLATVAGAPNIVRGGSHSGNVSALELAQQRLLDGLSSDYVPGSLLQSAWILMRDADFSPWEALKLVSLGPARAAGLKDRGAIEVGQRADWIRVREVRGQPTVREVWRNHRRVT
jgi:alpha-D-ribose 1-methylphosphonate 5-triphosphate diphosphatase